MSRNPSKSAFFEGGHFERRFQREGGIAHQTLLVPGDCSDFRFVWYQNIRSPSFSFVTIHASDRQTDGRTDGQTELRQQYRALHYMQSHDKNARRQHIDLKRSTLSWITSPSLQQLYIIGLSVYQSQSKTVAGHF